jgi:ribose transport system permease protein
MGRYIYAIGSNKEAARLSGVNVRHWEMMAYVVAGACAGIGGISYAAIYTTVLPAAGQGFELFAIAGAVIGGTSLAGGVGSVFGTLIGVLIMSVLSVGLPAMDLQSHYQTFFTGVVVIGAVLLDMYRMKKASEVRYLTQADEYREQALGRIRELKASGKAYEARALKAEMKTTYRRMKTEEKAEKARLRQEEREADRQFHESQRHERSDSDS